MGMGGAVPAEFEKPGSYVSNMFAAIDKSRQEMGKPPMEETRRRSWDQDNQRALAQMNRDPDWIPNLIAEVTARPRPLLSWENAGLVWHRAKLAGEYDNALRRIATAFDDGRTGDVEEARLHAGLIEDQLQQLDDAVGRNGTGSEAGRSLQAQKMGAGEDFSLVEMRLQKRAAVGGRRLTPAEDEQVTALHRQLEEAQRREAEAQTAKAQAQADAALQRIRADTAAKPQFHPKIIEAARKIVDALDQRADAARVRLKERLARTSSGVDPTLLLDLAEIGAAHLGHAALDFGEWSARMVSDLGDVVKPHLQAVYDQSHKILDQATRLADPKVRQALKEKTPAEQTASLAEKIQEKARAGKKDQITWYVQRLARLLVQQGVTEREPLIDAIHRVLADAIPGLTRRDAMDAISGYGDYRQLSKDAVSVQLRGMKGEMQQLAKLEDMAAGKPPLKSGLERRTLTEAERQLVKKVNESKFAFQVPMTDPATQLKSALDTYKTTLKNRIADLEDRMARGDFATRARRELQLDPEALKLKAESQRVKQRFQQMLRADQLRNRSRGERAADALVKWSRGFLLSGPSTLAKLTSAAFWRLASNPVEEAVGSVLRRVPGVRQIAARAPIEGGGFNVKAEARALTQAFTQGMADAVKTVATGKSVLDRVFGGRENAGSGEIDETRSVIDFFGNLHGALKAPVKRAAFTRAFEQQAAFYLGNGVDVSDPLVQTKMAVEAYKRANRDIFMQPNRFADRVRRFINSFEEKDKATGRVPVSGKVAATGLRVFTPILKVPSNIISETLTYATGLATGTGRATAALWKGADTLKPEQADLIMRELKKGSVGTAALLTGYFLPQAFGGFYQQGKKRDPKDVQYNGARVGGVNVSRTVLHNPMIETAQIGATAARVAESKLRKKDVEKQGLSAGAMAGALGLVDETPFVNEMFEASKVMNPYQKGPWLAELAKSRLVPQMLSQTAQWLDKDAQGNPVKRKTESVLQGIESGIPLLRETLPVKEPPPEPKATKAAHFRLR